MTRTEFYKAVAMKTGMTQKDTRTVFEAAQEVVLDALRADDEVKVFDGVSLSRVLREARTARNPHTGETMTIPAKYAPKAKFGKMFKTAVM
jgi:DNA-binding protein HU-beta